MMPKRNAAVSKSQKRAAPVSDRSTSSGSRRGAGPTASGTFTVRVPLALIRRGGRKVILTPSGAAWSPRQTRVDNSLVKAISRAFRWRKMLEDGTHAAVRDLAAAEKINSSYVSRVLRLTLLAPDIIEAVLDGRQSVALKIENIVKPFPVEWEAQRKAIDGRETASK
jgi:hypothetical protein